MSIDRAEISLSLADLSGNDSSVLKFLSLYLKKMISIIVIYPPQTRNMNIVHLSGSGGILTKPLNPKVLLTLVKNLLEEDI